MGPGGGSIDRRARTHGAKEYQAVENLRPFGGDRVFAANDPRCEWPVQPLTAGGGRAKNEKRHLMGHIGPEGFQAARQRTFEPTRRVAFRPAKLSLIAVEGKIVD